jgi:hypothetical protein
MPLSYQYVQYKEAEAQPTIEVEGMLHGRINCPGGKAYSLFKRRNRLAGQVIGTDLWILYFVLTYADMSV